MESPALVPYSRFYSDFSKEAVNDSNGGDYDGSVQPGEHPPGATPEPKPEFKHNSAAPRGLAPRGDSDVPDLIPVSDSDYDSDDSDSAHRPSAEHPPGATPATKPGFNRESPAPLGTAPRCDSDVPDLIPVSDSDYDSDDSDSDSAHGPSSSRPPSSEPPTPHVCNSLASFSAPQAPLSHPSPDADPGTPRLQPRPGLSPHLNPPSDDDLPDLTSGDDTDLSDVSDSESSSDWEDDHGQPFTRDSGIPGGFPVPDVQALESLRSPLSPGSTHGRPLDYGVLAGSVDHSWLARPLVHSEIASRASSAISARAERPTRRQARAVASANYDIPANGIRPWPRRSSDPPSPQPPAVTRELIDAIAAQDHLCSPDAPYPPALSGFVAKLEQWRLQLTRHFNFDTSCYAANTRRAADRIARRLDFLPKARFDKVMDVIRNGYTIPFSRPPPRFHRNANSPDLSNHMDAAWDALKKDIGHGAVLPCNLKRDGKPRVVSPVRTAPKGWRTGKRRFVINMRFLNRHIPDDESACSLDTLSRIRNLLTFPESAGTPAWGITMDLASGYHNFWISPHQWTYMGFALHRSELPVEAIEFLRARFPECEDHASGIFYFLMRALGFGLAPSCSVFSLIATSLAASWRRHAICGNPLRLTSYIDDFFALAKTIRETLIAAIELLYEATAAGLTINVGKCRLGPATLLKYLGILIDLRLRLFRLPVSRIERIAIQVVEIRQQVVRFPHVPAKWVAQLIGLLWSISPCCNRAVSIMARGLIALLTTAMCASVWRNPRSRLSRFTLKRLLSAFWDDDVRWTVLADDDLRFWESVDFYALRAPISADTLEVMASSIRLDTSQFDHANIGFLASDASETACGGGLLSFGAGTFEFDASGTFFSHLTRDLIGASSGLREIVAIYWMLVSLESRLPRRVVVFSDSRVACSAISRGSRVYAIQFVARLIFAWCLRHSVCLFACWSPRASDVNTVADTRSRWSDTYGHSTPKLVFLAADRIATRLWAAPLSFDRQASHLNVMPPRSLGRPPLPFNSLWNQPGSSGVDMFLQPVASWQGNINFIHPAAPTIGRVLSFLPATSSRSVVVIPCRFVDNCPWWSTFTVAGGPGVRHSERLLDFLVVAVDHSC